MAEMTKTHLIIGETRFLIVARKSRFTREGIKMEHLKLKGENGKAYDGFLRYRADGTFQIV